MLKKSSGQRRERRNALFAFAAVTMRARRGYSDPVANNPQLAGFSVRSGAGSAETGLVGRAGRIRTSRWSCSRSASKPLNGRMNFSTIETRDQATDLLARVSNQ
jgi:hypothetical protein